MRNTVAIFMAALAVVSCSKSSGGGSSLVGSTSIDAQFIDDPVKGLEFESSLGNGKTASQGKFKCKKGEAVKFKIAGLELGEAVCGEKIFVDDLVSKELGHTPGKVAAIIQSFAVAGTDELDLTPALALIPANHLQGMNLNAGTFEADVAAKVNVPELSSVSVAPVTVAAARTKLDENLGKFSSIPNFLKEAMDESLGDDMKITGKLSSKDPYDYCYDYVQGEINVSKTGDLYFLNVAKFASFDALDAYDPEDNLCTNLGWCDDHRSDYVTLPAAKPITSDKINYLVINRVVEDDEVVYETRTAAQLQASVKNGAVVISGSLKESGVVITDNGDTANISCEYTLTSNEVSIPSTGPASEDDGDDEDDADAPAEAVGVWNRVVESCTGALTITDDNTPDYGGIKIGVVDVVDHITYTGELGAYVGVTSTHYFEDEWIIQQDYAEGYFSASFKGVNDFSWTFAKTDEGSCQGTFVKQIPE